MSIADTSNVLLREGIMPYDINSYLFDKPSTPLGNKDYYPDYNHADYDSFVKPNQDNIVAKKKKANAKMCKFALISALALIPVTYLMIKNKSAVKNIASKTFNRVKNGFAIVGNGVSNFFKKVFKHKP